MKKLIALLLAVLMILSVFTACGAKEEAAPEQKEETAAAPEKEEAKEEEKEEPKEEAKEEEKEEEPAEAEPSVLTVAVAQGGDNSSQYWARLCEAFNELHPEVEIELIADPKIADVIRPQIVAGDAPDVYSPQSASEELLSAMIREGKVMDLTEVFAGPGIDDETPLKDQINDGVLSSTRCDPLQNGTVLAAPYTSRAKAMVYNKTLFEEKGWELPVTWDDFFELGDKAKAEGIALMTYAGTYPDYLDTLMISSLGAALGTEKMYELSLYGEGILTTPEATQILENVARIGQEGYLLEGTVGLNHTQSQAEFILNKALFCPNGDWISNEMQDAPHAEGFEYGMCPAPVLEEGQTPRMATGSSVVVVPSDAKNPEMAKEFIRFMYTEEGLKIFAEVGGVLVPSKKAVAVTAGMFDDQLTSMREVFSMVEQFMFAWGSVPEGSKIVMADVIYAPIAEVMTGKMSAADWINGIEAAFHEVNSVS